MSISIQHVPMIMLAAVFAFHAVGCGTILYPERRNQTAGRIDVGVALLDGFWLLIGIIPGVIALAVDFSTGAIYLPSDEEAGGSSSGYRVVRYDPATATRREIEALISQETGLDFRFSDGRYRMIRIHDVGEFEDYLATLDPISLHASLQGTSSH